MSYINEKETINFSNFQILKSNINLDLNFLNFSNTIFNFINNSFIKELNYSVNTNLLNINNLNILNTKQKINNNNYINSCLDSIDQKLLSNIYQIPEENFFKLFPNSKKIINEDKKKLMLLN